jgi:hypothetical protein
MRQYVLVLEDLGRRRAATHMTGDIEPTPVGSVELARAAVGSARGGFENGGANRAMRELNRASSRLLLKERLDLDAPPSVSRVAASLRHRSYCAAVNALRLSYLGDGQHLVHGDYFPGAGWRAGTAQLRRAGRNHPAVRIIDRSSASCA